MKNPSEIRFIATNFVNLQGLRTVPIGIFIILSALLSNYLWVIGYAEAPLWTRSFTEVGKYAVIVGLLIVCMIVSLLLIDKYYFQNYGKVRRSAESTRFEWLIQIVGSIILLGALWVDITFRLPVSCIGLVFAIVLIADYIRITWLVGGRFLLYYPIGAIVIAFVSLMPLLGITKWWLAVGLVNEFVGIEIVVGIFCIIAGLWGHLFLLNVLSSKCEVTNDHTV